MLVMLNVSSFNSNICLFTMIINIGQVYLIKKGKFSITAFALIKQNGQLFGGYSDQNMIFSSA